MYPRGLVSRVKGERKKVWDSMQKKCEVSLQHEILSLTDASVELTQAEPAEGHRGEQRQC